MPKIDKIDELWFKEKIAERGTSQRQIAKKLGKHPSSISNLLQGVRRLTVSEAAAWSVLLGQPLAEVLARAGVRVDSQSVPLAGFVDSEWDLVPVTGNKAQSIPSPFGATRHMVAARIDDPTSLMYGWTLFYEARESIDVDCVGRLCVLRLVDGENVVRMVRRSNGNKELTLVNLKDSSTTEVKVESASPVMWIKV
jgi:transcriptional regulator with XRE-family HTH domain